MEDFEEGYQRFCDNLPAGMAAEHSAEWVNDVNEAIAAFENDLASFYGSGKTLNTLGGDVAEFWHASTYNINRAVAQDAGPVAHVPRSHGFASPDIQLVSADGDDVEKVVKSYQAKFYASPEKSARAQAATYGQLAHSKPTAKLMVDAGLAGENDPVYAGYDRLMPSDQVDDAKSWLHKRALEEASKRPEQVHRYADTEKKAVGNVDAGRGYKSDDLSKAGSRKLAQDVRDGKFDPKNYRLTAAQKITPEMLLEDSVRTGATAAAIAAALALAPALIETVQGVFTEGEVDTRTLKEGGLNAIGAGARGFISGAVASAVTTAAKADMLPFIENLGPASIAVIAVIAAKAVEGSVEVAVGKMSQDELAVELAQTTVVATASQAGGVVGQALIPTMPVVGYILGSLAGSVIGNLAVMATGKLTLALCVESGVTLFGLVDQDYVLPEHVLEELGLSNFDFEAYSIDEFVPDVFAPQAFAFDEFRPASFDMGFIRRGVIGVRKVGYLG